MKKVIVKKGTRVCSKELGGCGRTIWEGEVCYKQIRVRMKRKTRYICEECWRRISY